MDFTVLKTVRTPGTIFKFFLPINCENFEKKIDFWKEDIEIEEITVNFP